MRYLVRIRILKTVENANSKEEAIDIALNDIKENGIIEVDKL